MGNCLGASSSAPSTTAIDDNLPHAAPPGLTNTNTNSSLPRDSAGTNNNSSREDESVDAEANRVEQSQPQPSSQAPNRRPTIAEMAAAEEARRRPLPILPDDPNFTPSCNGRNGWQWQHLYEQREELGRGAFGEVFLGKHKKASYPAEKGDYFAPEWKDVAIKKTEPNLLDSRGGRIFQSYDDLENHCQEIKTLIRLQQSTASSGNSKVLFLYEYFKSDRSFYMVTERLGQELEEWRATCEPFTEKMAINICRTILNAIDFMRSRDVVHRDIKMQNIMFRKNGDFRTLKIVDFGLARVLDNEPARDFCGSIGYIAPEIYLGMSYRFEVDVFAFGVLLFRLLSGERPFPSSNQDILKRHTIELRYNVQGADWENISSSSKDLVRRLLINKQERITAEQALDHPWFSEEGTSILRADLSHLGTGSFRSKAFARSYAPTASETSGDGVRFWMDDSFELALATMMSCEIYSGLVVDRTKSSRRDGSSVGLICIEELVSPIATSVPEYIGRLQSYSEKDCRQICLHLTKCIEILHDVGIAHRNLHMENILIDPFGKISLKGLQYSQPIKENHPLTGHFGYHYSWYAFKAPEVDSAFVHDKSVDLWSLGAIIYMLLTGLPPFRGDGAGLIEAKHNGDFAFDVAVPSAQAQRLIRRLLKVNPEDRCTIDDVLNDEWMIESDDYLERFDLELAMYNLRDWTEV